MLEVLAEVVVPYIDPVDEDILNPVLEVLKEATNKTWEEIMGMIK